MKKFILIFFLFFFFHPAVAADNLPEKVFPAQVKKVLEEKEVPIADGTLVRVQKLELMGLAGEMKGKVFQYSGEEIPEAVSGKYKEGDKVSIEASYDDQGHLKYFIRDYYRVNSLKWLFVVFVFFLLAVGRGKGLRSLISLAASFFIIMKFILPQIMDGGDPLIITLFGSLAILLLIIYLTEGFRASAHLAVVSIFFSLLLTIALSWIFMTSARLTGLANEEASFLVGLGSGLIDFRGLLLAGIIIGALGVLDDVVISQIAAVKEIYNTDKLQSHKEIFKKSFSIGISHISSMTNTLFLAYAGASLPLLILFLSGQSAFSSPIQALNNEALATEIVRTLVGSIGLIFSVPISTLLAVWWFTRKK